MNAEGCWTPREDPVTGFTPDKSVRGVRLSRPSGKNATMKTRCEVLPSDDEPRKKGRFENGSSGGARGGRG
jgi:hypothetical protein